MGLQLGTQFRSPLAAICNIAQRFFTYAVVGAVATFCSYSLLILQVEGLHIRPLLASAVAFIGGAFASYGLNTSITFGDRRNTSWPLPKFLIISSVGLGLNTFFMASIITVFRVHYLIAQATATAIVLVWNFGGHFLWAFANQSD
jgi:putative flippase GtrA